ncbi:MAG TPA: Ig-like domain-containing protein, partial [Anaerolineales bacterium]|nr:Ig-like domain-containing protein [Anaerolineales bacterium]
MTKRRVAPTLNLLLLVALLLTSCGGAPIVTVSNTSTPAIPTPTAFAQSLPPGLVETDPPLGSVIGHQSPITFYFNQPVNKASAEAALTGLPAGAFTWHDDATLKFTPTQPYPVNTPLTFSIANSLQSANGFGLTESIGLSFTVADYLRATNLLPQPGAEDVNVDAAIVASFNQPVVALGGDPASQPPAFEIQPPVQGRGEWINTSTYIFYPEPAMAGGTEYTVSLDMNLKTASGVGWSGTERVVWTFTTSRPSVVSLEPSVMELLPLDPEIKLTFNQPMNSESVESNFSFSGTEGALAGEFSWNEAGTEMTFVPDDLLGRNVGYTIHLDAAASSRGGMVLGADYGAVYTTYDHFVVSSTRTDFGTTTFTFNSPLASANYDNLVSVFPELDNLQTQVSENGLELYVYGDYSPDTTYTFELSARIRDRWGQSLGDAFIVETHTPPLPSMLNIPLFGWPMVFVRPDEPVLYADAVNIQNVNTTVAPLTLQDFFSLQNSYDNQQAYIPSSPTALSQTFELPPGRTNDVQIGLTQPNTQLLPGLYYAQVASPQIETRNIYLVASSQVNLTFKLGATEALVWAVDLPSQTPVANAPVTIYDDVG